MRLKKIIIENFLSFGEKQELEFFQDQAIIVGENGCGKTNIIRAIKFVLKHWCGNVSWEKHKLWSRNSNTMVLLKFSLEEEDKTNLAELCRFAHLPCDGHNLNQKCTKDPRQAYTEAENKYHNDYFSDIEIGLVGSNDDIILRGFLTCNNWLLYCGGPCDVETKLFSRSTSAEIMNVIHNVIMQQQFNSLYEIGIRHDTHQHCKHVPDLTVKLDRVLRFFKYNKKIRSDLTLIDAINYIAKKRLVVVREDRGLLDHLSFENKTHDMSFSQIEEALFDLKLGNSSAFRDIQQRFGEFFPGLHDITFLPAIKDDSSKPSHNFISGNVNVVFSIINSQSNTQLHFNEVPGGVCELLHLLIVFNVPNFTTILLDEPGRSLHPTMITKLQHLIKDIKNKSFLLITHSPSMISEYTIKITRRLSRSNGHTRVLSIMPTDPKLLKWACDPLRHPVFFAPGVLFVEGQSEARFFKALATCLQEGLMEKKYIFTWEIISMGSKTFTSQAKSLASKWQSIPYSILLDWDALVNDKKDNKVVEWQGLDWDCASNSVLLRLLPDFNKEKDDDDNTFWNRFNIYSKDNRWAYVWPPKHRDLEAVTGVKKSSWKEIHFTRLQKMVIAMFDYTDHIRAIFEGIGMHSRATWPKTELNQAVYSAAWVY